MKQNNNIIVVGIFVIAISLAMVGVHVFPPLSYANHEMLISDAYLNLNVDRAIDQADPNNPIYSAVVTNVANLKVDDIKFSGVFSNARVQKIEQIDGTNTEYIQFSKPYNVDELNGGGGLIIDDRHYNVVDNYVKVLSDKIDKSTGLTSFSPSDTAKPFKTAGDFFKIFTDKNVFEPETSAFFSKLTVVSSLVSVGLPALFSILDALGIYGSSPKADPVLEKLTEISNQIDKLAKATETQAQEIHNQLNRDRYADHVNGFIAKQSEFDSQWQITKVRPFMNILNKVAEQANIPKNKDGIVDFSDKDNINKIVSFLNNSGDTGKAYMESLDVYGSAIYANYYDVNKGSSVLNDEYFVQMLNILKYVAGDTSYSIGTLSAPNFMEVFGAFSDLAYDWKHQELEPSRSVLNAMYNICVGMAMPYWMAVQLDKTRNLKNYNNSQADIDLIYDNDPGCEISKCKVKENETKIVALKKIQIISETNNDTDEIVVSTIVNKLDQLQKQRDKEDKRLNKIEATYKGGSLSDNGKVVSNVTGQTYYRGLREIDPTDFCHYPAYLLKKFPSTIKTDFNCPTSGNKIWSRDQFDKMEYAAKIRNTTLKAEINSFAYKSDVTWLYTYDCSTRYDYASVWYDEYNAWMYCSVYPIGNNSASSLNKKPEIFHAYYHKSIFSEQKYVEDRPLGKYKIAELAIF
ncbi:MAG: hypothetical protein LBT99_03860 [Bifidobacteriaceae bacterium]|nr:hypothetical protein [Bifidobacteriaceae bacterium]